MCDKNHSNNNQKLLIDFNSPLQRKLEIVKSELTPLLPSPSSSPANNKTSVCSTSECDVANNPFDMVAHQTNLNIRMLNDPFELVYQRALSPKLSYISIMQSDEIEGISPIPVTVKTELLSPPQDSNSSIFANSVAPSVMDQSLDLLNRSICGTEEDSLLCIEDVTDPTGRMFLSLSDCSNVSKQSQRKIQSDDIIVENTYKETGIRPNMNKSCKTFGISKDISEIKNNSLGDLSLSEEQYDICHSDYKTNLSSQVSNTSRPQTDEELKTMVANRVNACIQNALEQSRSCANVSMSTLHHKRSHSFSSVSFASTGVTNKFTDCINNSILNVSLDRARRLSNNISFNAVDTSCANRLYHRSSYSDMFFEPPICTSKKEKNEIRSGCEILRDTSDGTKNPLSTSLCLDVPVDCGNEKNGNDSVFEEANALAIVFMVDSFTQPHTSDGEEENILTSRPEWEVSQLKLPKFNSEEEEDTDVSAPVPCLENISPIKKLCIEDNKNKCESFISSCRELLPLTSQHIQDLSLHTRLSSNKENKVIPDVILPPPLNVVGEKDMRVKPKRNQQVAKKGPLKAVVPIHNMTRDTDCEKTGAVGSTPLVAVKLPPSPSRSSTPVKSTCQKIDEGMESRTGAIKKDRINRSFTSPAASSTVPILRRTNSLTSGIPALKSPSVSLLKTELTTPKLLTPQKSSNNLQFNVSGLVVTSTPARKDRFVSSRKSNNCLPSPIPSTGSKDLVPKRSKLIPKSHHERSKSASNIQQVKSLHSRKEKHSSLTEKVHSQISSIKLSYSAFKKNHSESSNDIHVKPLVVKNLNNQHTEYNEVEQKRIKPITQLLTKLKKSPVIPADKENIRPF